MRREGILYLSMMARSSHYCINVLSGSQRLRESLIKTIEIGCDFEFIF
jgi:hypothetical protein